MMRNKGPQRTYYFKRSCTKTAAVSSQSNPVINYYLFSLNDLPDYTEFTALYDQYQIAAVKISFIPLVSQVTSNIESTYSVLAPTLANYYRSYSAIDYNNTSASGVTGPDNLREYQTYKWKPLPRTHSRYLKPKPIMQNGGSALNYTLPGKVPWFDVATGSNEGYAGLFFGYDAMPDLPNGTAIYTIECKYYLKFRTVR